MFSAHAVPENMRAMVYDARGPGKMAWHSIQQVPRIGKDQLLIKVDAGSLNPYDLKVTESQTLFMTNKGHPVGRDMAGTVAAVGSRVHGFSTGDKVFGLAPGCCQFAVANVHRITHIPADANSMEYGTIAFSGVVAHQILSKHWLDRPDYTVRTILVIGASGGVGSSVVQIARAFGGPELVIYGICSHKKAQYVKEIGCSQAIEYTVRDFDIARLLPAGSIDLIIDLVSGVPGNPNYVERGFTLLRTSGRYVCLNSTNSMDWVRAYMTETCGCNIQRSRFDLFSVNQKRPARNLLVVARLIEEGKLKSFVSQDVPLAETSIRRALHAVKQGHTKGKIRVVPETYSTTV
jgi:NADPH:quinone reductase-like Zn-dependent oxidoreductase